MSKESAVAKATQDIVSQMAAKYSMDRGQLLSTLRKTLIAPKKVVRQGQEHFVEASEEEIFVFLQVAKEYNLNPFIKEIVAFTNRRGGVVPYVTIDGWISLINRNKRFAGIKTTNHYNSEDKLYACTAVIRVRDSEMPIGYYEVEITELLSECKRGTDPWSQSESRMLRHKAVIQCGRYAFGLAGLYDEDEAERVVEAIDVTPGEEGSSIMPKAKELPASAPPPPPAKATPPRETKGKAKPEPEKEAPAAAAAEGEVVDEPGGTEPEGEEEEHPFEDAPAAGQKIERKDGNKMTDEEKRSEIVMNCEEWLLKQGTPEDAVESEIPRAVEHFSGFESEGTTFKKSDVSHLKGKWLNTTLGKSRKEIGV